ncbi:hypothetical protein TKK_0001639 [Trichogramma kaykai]
MANEKTLIIAAWNANSLAQRSLELKSFLIMNKIDIMFISETHFTKKTYLKIPNYIIYDTQHPSGRAHSGTAIIIKSSIKHYELEINKEDNLQATSITAETYKNPITFLAIYCSPEHTIKQEYFTKFFKKLGSLQFITGPQMLTLEIINIIDANMKAQLLLLPSRVRYTPVRKPFRLHQDFDHLTAS